MVEHPTPFITIVRGSEEPDRVRDSDIAFGPWISASTDDSRRITESRTTISMSEGPEPIVILNGKQLKPGSERRTEILRRSELSPFLGWVEPAFMNELATDLDLDDSLKTRCAVMDRLFPELAALKTGSPYDEMLATESTRRTVLRAQLRERATDGVAAADCQARFEKWLIEEASRRVPDGPQGWIEYSHLMGRPHPLHPGSV